MQARRRLDAEAIISMQAQTLALAAELAEAVGVHRRRQVQSGRRLSVSPIFPAMQGIRSERGRRRTRDRRCRHYPDILKDTHFCIELGRYLVGEAGVYLCRVVDKQGQPWRDFPRDRWRLASPIGSVRQFRYRHPPQLSGRNCHALRCPEPDEVAIGGRLPVHAARPPIR